MVSTDAGCSAYRVDAVHLYSADSNVFTGAIALADLFAGITKLQ